MIQHAKFYDDIHSGVTLEAVTKPHPVERRRHLFKPSEWDFEEPAAFTRIARSPVELAMITGVIIRLFRAVVLTHGSATTSYLVASLVLGSLFLLGMATLHLGRFPVREWPWRAPLFAVFETAGEMLVSLVLIALHREPWGTARAEFTDHEVDGGHAVRADRDAHVDIGRKPAHERLDERRAPQDVEVLLALGALIILRKRSATA